MQISSSLENNTFNFAFPLMDNSCYKWMFPVWATNKNDWSVGKKLIERIASVMGILTNVCGVSMHVNTTTSMCPTEDLSHTECLTCFCCLRHCVNSLKSLKSLIASLENRKPRAQSLARLLKVSLKEKRHCTFKIISYKDSQIAHPTAETSFGAPVCIAMKDGESWRDLSHLTII